MNGIRKMAAILLIVCLIGGALPAVSFAEKREETKTEALKTEALKNQAQEAGEQIFPYGELCAYVADAIDHGTPDENGRISVDVRSFSLKVGELSAFQSELLFTNPQLFYLSGALSYSYSGDNVAALFFTLDVDPSELEAKKIRFNEMADALCAMKDETWSDLETVVFFSDYLAAHYEYDLTYSNYDAYSFLEQKTGVCQAYTAVFTLLMNRFGIPCTYAKSDNINHIWNVVKVGGAWYHLDVTHNDPTYDRPGSAHHTYTLTGSTSTYELKSTYAENLRTPTNVDDMVIGADITVSETDCPLIPDLRNGKSFAPVVWSGSRFYTITQDDSTAKLVACDFGQGEAQTVRTMPRGWRIPGSSYYYSGNYSTLAAHGRFLYYFDSSAIYGFDTFTEEETELVCAEDGAVIYGLIGSEDGLIYYTGASPTERSYTAVNVLLPTYTITWVIGDESFTTAATFGSNPLSEFNGSTEREDENGVSYIFIGWSPEVVPATEDAVYTALYEERRLFTEGDVNGDGNVNITDVTSLLNILADGVQSVTPLTDMNGDGVLTISDVSALLDLISNQKAS